MPELVTSHSSKEKGAALVESIASIVILGFMFLVSVDLIGFCIERALFNVAMERVAAYAQLGNEVSGLSRTQSVKLRFTEIADSLGLKLKAPYNINSTVPALSDYDYFGVCELDDLASCNIQNGDDLLDDDEPFYLTGTIQRSFLYLGIFGGGDHTHSNFVILERPRPGGPIY